MRPPTTLTARLVLTTALLAVLATTLVGVLTTLAVRQYLTDQLDRDVATSLERVRRIPPAAVLDPGGPGSPASPSPQDADGDGRRGDRIGPGDAVGSLTALRVPGVGWQGFATLQGSDGTAVRRSLDAAALALLADVPADGRAHRVRLPGLGGYVVAVTRDGAAAAGLPTADVDDVVAGVVRAVVVLGLVAALASAAAAATLVRRQLRPLREVARTAHAVAALPLADGEIALDERVPARLADERSEVGQVGAALNTLLDHVAGSLEARHRSEQQVRQFVADASHELRTPLATIAGYTELARRRPDDAAMAGVALGKVEEEAGRMTALVEDLLLLARLDAGRPLEREAVDLTRLCVEAVADARVLAPGHRWRLDLPGAADGSPDGHEPVTVVGDPLRLHQVLTNLLTNARKYTPEGSTITVRVRPGGLTVHDDGPGFPPDLVEHAFERFARGDAARTRQGGVGLGLALVQAIVASHGGTVSLRSAPGDTAIEVRLPQA
ncbi:HAMP domain-containing histidine kinase [Nocardioides sp. TRM66260-LWL]|nr:HAMP domain-containing sensor histidine kinase [Nocardioides sp. TRM66260-LWL]MBZ5734439.1 HAMP domain-containing histidine kinase [Nocardioides sp. TRM66260-LWL]